MKRYAEEDRAELCASALRKGGDEGEDLSDYIESTVSFEASGALRKIIDQRDLEIAEHLRSQVFHPEKLELIRLGLNMSWRAIMWMRSIIKFDHAAVADANALPLANDWRLTPSSMCLNYGQSPRCVSMKQHECRVLRQTCNKTIGRQHM